LPRKQAALSALDERDKIVNFEQQSTLRVAVKSSRKMADSNRQSDNCRAVLDLLQIAIYCTDIEGCLTYFNPAAVEFAGRVPQLGVDRWCVTWKLFRTDGAYLPHDQCPMAIALKEGRPVWGEEAIAERPDGTRRRFTPYPQPVRDSNGKMIGGTNMLLDLDHDKRDEGTAGLLLSVVTAFGDVIVQENLAQGMRSDGEKPNPVCVSCGLPISKPKTASVVMHVECYQKRERIQPPPTELEAWRLFEQFNRSNRDPLKSFRKIRENQK
jgi:PAS domain-containing protein